MNIISNPFTDDNVGGVWFPPSSFYNEENNEEPSPSLQGPNKSYSVDIVEDKTESSIVENTDKKRSEIFEQFQAIDMDNFGEEKTQTSNLESTNKTRSEMLFEAIDADNATYYKESDSTEYSSSDTDSSYFPSEDTSSNDIEEDSRQWTPANNNTGEGWGTLAAKATSYALSGLKSFFWGSSSKEVATQEKIVNKNNLAADQIKEKAIAEFNKSEKAKQKVIIIPGGTGHIGREFALDAIKKGYNVIVTSRDVSAYKDHENDNLHYVQASSEDQAKPEFWNQLMSKYSEAESVTLVNAVGSPEAPKGKTLRDVNVVPADAMATAMKDLEDNGVLKTARFVQLSSMGAIMLEDDPYGTTKKEAEDLILTHGPKNICILEVGYAYQAAVKGQINKIDNTHSYGPEQIASLPWQPILGNGQQLLQPVYTGDIVDAGLNFREGVKVIKAIGSEVLTQENFIGYFCQLKDKEYNPVYVNLDLVEPLAESFHKGHFSSYAVRGCRKLEKEDMIYDTKEFEEAVGHPLSKLDDVYGDLKGKKLYYPRPPIVHHVKDTAKKVYNNEDNARENIKKTAVILGKIVFSQKNNRKAIKNALKDL